MYENGEYLYILIPVILYCIIREITNAWAFSIYQLYIKSKKNDTTMMSDQVSQNERTIIFE